MKALLHRAGQVLGDVVFPPVCVACNKLVENSEYRHVCTTCTEAFDFVSEPACTVCGHPFYGELAGERMCPHCEGLVPAFREGRTCVLYKGPARALVHELKYHHGLFVLKDMEAIIARTPRIVGWLRDAVLVPVPLHPRKKRERGYNQTLHLAECFARAAGGTTRVAELLRRDVDTISQTAFDRKTRRINLRNVFSLCHRAALDPNQHYVIVDDVFTTGSTLNSCAGVLRQAGCLNLDIVTFGHG